MTRIGDRLSHPFHPHGSAGGPAHQHEPASDRLDRGLSSLFGPAQIGPYDEPPGEPEDVACPDCAQPMSQHRIDRSEGRSRAYCPAED